MIPELLQQDFYIIIIPAWMEDTRHRSNLPADQGEVSLKRSVSKCATGMRESVWICEISKGSPCDRSGSPGNIQATYPFQILAMNHIRSLPLSFKGSTELFNLFLCGCEGRCVSDSATITDYYKESVLRKVIASKVIRHVRAKINVRFLSCAFSDSGPENV